MDHVAIWHYKMNIMCASLDYRFIGETSLISDTTLLPTENYTFIMPVLLPFKTNLQE